MVLVLDEGASNFNSGDIITFQDPSKSLDTNYNNGTEEQPGTDGYIKSVTNLTVRYADPTITDGGAQANKVTTYNITGFNENIIWNIQNPSGPGPSAPIITYASSTGTTKFPADIEYFQVLTGMTLSEYKSKSVRDHNPFTLGRRYLKIAEGGGLNNVENNTAFGFDMKNKFIESNQMNIWSNDGGVMNDPNNPPVWCSQYIGSISPTQTSDYGNKKVLFLMRGVDVHSPSIDMKIDLSRLFGRWERDWNPNRFWLFPDNGKSFIIRGNFKMNFPIRASYTTPGSNSLSCTNHGLLYDNDGTTNGGGYDKTTQSTIFNKSYLFEYKTIGSGLGVNNYQTYFSHMHKYYSGVGASLHPSYDNITGWNLGSNQSSILGLITQYRDLISNVLYADGESFYPHWNSYYMLWMKIF